MDDSNRDKTEADTPTEGNGHSQVDELILDASIPPSAAAMREKILAAQDERSEQVPIPEWGVTIEVRSMTGQERSRALEKYLNGETGAIDFEAMTPEIMIRTCYHPTTGEAIFQPGDAPLLNQKNAGALETLGQAALRLSGLDRRAKEAAGKDS